MTFEQALHRLDEIAERLGDGGTTLEESLALYAEGAGLIERCSRELGEAKLKLETQRLQTDRETDGLYSAALGRPADGRAAAQGLQRTGIPLPNSEGCF